MTRRSGQGTRNDIAARDQGELEAIYAGARCRGQDPELFYPETTNAKYYGDARAICHSGCPVLTRCLRYALKHNENYGVWGGCCANERRELKRQLREGRSIEPLLERMEATAE